MPAFPGFSSRRGVTAALAALVALCAALSLLMPLLRYWALSSVYYDLGQYATNYHLLALDGELGIVFRSHAHPVMLLVAPLFAAFPRIETLLIQQSLTLVAGLAAYAALWRRVGAGPALGGALLAVASLSFWTAALLDYHFEHMLLLGYCAFFLSLERNGRWIRVELLLIAAFIMAIKESYALTALGLGLYLILAGRHRMVGLAIVATAATYFLVVVMRVIPAFSDGQASGELWAPAFGHLGRTPLEMLWNLVTRPSVLVEAEIFTVRKIVYLAALLGPFAMALWRAPLLLIPALPHLAIALLSLNPNHVYLANQYTIPVLVPCLVATAYVAAARPEWGLPIRWLERALKTDAPRIAAMLALGGSVIVLALFGSSPISRLFLTPSADGFSISSYLPSGRDARVRDLIEAAVPVDRSLTVSMQNNLHLGRLSIRTNALAFPQSAFSPLQVQCHRAPDGAAARLDPKCGRPGRRGAVLADYVVLDRGRTGFIDDRPVGTGPNAPSQAAFDALAGRLPDSFDRILADDGLEVWRRRAP